MEQVGLVEEVTFHCYQGKTFAFDVLWWVDTANTQPAVITSARASIKEADAVGAPLIINLAPTFTGNRVIIRLTPAQTLAITQQSGFLEVEASTATETKALTRGAVRFHPEVSE